MRNAVTVSLDLARGGRWEAREKRRLQGKAEGQSPQQLRDVSCPKVQMSMDLNHLEVVIF